MIRLVEALGFRSLKYVHQPLDSFQVLVGPNASGKSTFLGAVNLLGRLIDSPRDLTGPLRELSTNFRDLTFMRTGTGFELALEAVIPKKLRNTKEGSARNGHHLVRYEIAIGESETAALSVLAENLWLRAADEPDVAPPQRTLFPFPPQSPESLVTTRTPKGWKKVASKTARNDYFSSETSGWNAPFNFGSTRLARTVIVNPEIESWVWSTSPQVDEV